MTLSVGTNDTLGHVSLTATLSNCDEEFHFMELTGLKVDKISCPSGSRMSAVLLHHFGHRREHRLCAMCDIDDGDGTFELAVCRRAVFGKLS